MPIARSTSRPLRPGASRLAVAALLAATLGGLLLSALVGPAAPRARADDVTVSVDTLRTGWDRSEAALSPAAVGASDFGQLFSAVVDGAVYAQPLVVGSLVVVTTENATAYGIDKVSGAVRWTRHFGAPFEAATIGCGDLTPDLGSTSTPVYDPSSGLVYLTTKLADGVDAQHPHWYLQAVSATDGSVAPGFPVTIAGTPDNTPGLPFDPYYELQRPGLLLLGGTVYAAFGAHCDIQPYRGYVVGVGTRSHAVTAMWSSESGSGAGATSAAGIWQSGGGLVSDGPGRILLTTGNGISPPPGPGDSPPGTLAESVVRLQVGADGALSPASFFAPADAPSLDEFDTDLGSGGPMGLPPAFGTTALPHLLVQVGKDGRVFLLDRDHLGGRMQGPGGTDAPVQVVGPYAGVWGHPAAYGGEGGYVYTVENQGFLRALAYGVDGSGRPTLSSVGTSRGTFGFSSGSPVVTSDGTTPGSALVWVVYVPNSIGVGAQLRAYRAVPSGGVLTQVWSAPLGTAAKFAVPATDAGRVYVGTRDGHVLGFGRPASPALVTAPVDFGRVDVGSSATRTATLTASRDVQVTGLSGGGGFTVTPPALPVLLHAGEALRVPVRFAPTTPGAVTSTLTVATDAGAFGADLHGYATQDGLLAVPGSLDFGQVALGTGAKTLSVTIANSGRTATTLRATTTPSAPFAVGSLPAAGTVLQPQQSVTVAVTYAPTAAGRDAGSLRVGSSTGGVTVRLIGSAISGRSHLTLTPRTTDVGTVAVGSSKVATFDIGNTGTIPLTVTKAKAPAGAFSTDTPLSEGLTLAPGAVVHQRVTFAPTADGAVSATYLVSSDDGRGPQLETLVGTGSTPLPPATTWRLNGSAKVVGASRLRLTDTGPDEAGSAIYRTPVATDGLVATFTARLGGGDGADGMALVLLDPATSSPTSLGAGGGGLGYAGLDGVMVGLDTYQGVSDPPTDFVGVATGVQTGEVAWATTTPPLLLRDVPVQVTVRLAGGVLRVTVGTTTLAPVDVSAVVGPTAYVGFTGGTGGLTDNHDVTASTILPGHL